MGAKKDLRIYPAFLIEDEGCICVTFPDLSGCATQGDTLEAALSNAKEALEGYLYCLEEDGDSIPAPTPLDALIVPEGQKSTMVSVRMDIVREEEARRSISKTVTIPAWLNKIAVEANVNFSQILQEGLRSRLGV